MKGISWEDKQEIKKQRKRILQEIIEKNKVYNQDEIRKIFKKVYQIEIGQSTISRYLNEMGIGRDEKTNRLILGHRIARKKEANKLVGILKSAGGTIVEGNWESIMIRMKPTYVEAVAEQMEQLFAVENISVHVFPGFNGAMLVYFDEKDASKVRNYLKQVVDYYQ